MPLKPWTDPAIAAGFEKHFDETLHAATDPKPNQPGYKSPVRVSAGEMFGPIANCDFCRRWQMLDLSNFEQADQTAVAQRMTQLGWLTTAEGRDACPMCSSGRR
jgi:hypothetical protein